MAEISLKPQEQQKGISLAPKQKVLKDEEVIRSRVQKADYALAEDSPGQEELYASFWLDMEDRVRKQAALSEVLRDRQEWMQTSSDLVKTVAAEGREMTDLERSFVLDRPVAEVSEETALEKRYARRYVQEVDPENESGSSESAFDIVGKQQLAQRNFEDLQQRYNETSWASWGWDLAKSIIPFQDWYVLRNKLDGMEPTSVLTGRNLQEQIRSLYFLPSAEEFNQKLVEATNEIAEDNILNAMQFAQAAIAYSTADEFLDNAFFGMDVADVATLGGSAVAGIALRSARGARAGLKVKSAIRESANSKMSSVDQKVVAGDLEGAAEDGVKDKLAASGMMDTEGVTDISDGAARSTGPETILEDLGKQGFGLGDPENYFRAAGTLSNERQRRVMESLARNKDILKSSLTDIQSITRIDDDAFQAGVARAKQEFKRTNFRLEDGIVEITPYRESDEIFGGVDHVEFIIGKKDATAFKSPEQAETYAKKVYRLPEGGYTIGGRGDSYFLRMTKSVREDDLSIADLRLNTDNQAQVNWQQRWLSAVRNPDYLRGKDPSDWAGTATFGGNAVMARMTEVAKSIGKLGKNEAERLGTVMNEARFKTRQVVDPETGLPETVPGKFYKDVGEFERAYLDRGFPMPSDKEINAYFSFRQLMDYDHTVRNLGVYRDKARLGIEQKSVGWIHTDETGKKIYKNSPFFEGRDLDALPDRNGTPYTIGWYNGDTGKTKFRLSTSVGAYNEWKEIDELLGKGYRIIQVADPRAPALRDLLGTGGEPLQYLVVRDAKQKPLSSVQVPYNEGGHWIYPQTGQYLKQPRTHETRFKRKMYDGDMTIHHVQGTKQGEELRDAYEQARLMYLADDPNLDSFAQRNLPYDGDELTARFEDGTFDPNVPFVLTQHGQRVADTVNLRNTIGEYVDSGQNEHSLLGRINTQYAQERGERLTTVKNIGTEANPEFKLSGAPLMDSKMALARSMAQLARSRFFDDYKHRTVENYIHQFKDILDHSEAELRANPMLFIHDQKFIKGADEAAVAAAKNARRSLIYLLGVDQHDMGVMKWAHQKTIDEIIKVHGQDSRLLEKFRWTRDADPSTVMRSMVFDLKLGLFNIVQFPLQGLAIRHAAAIDGNPLRAIQANYLYWSMKMRSMASSNKGVQSRMGKMMSSVLGVKQETVNELYDLYHRVGASVFEGEYARIDDYLNPQQLYGPGNVGSKGLHAGRFFFKEGNLWHRGTAFSTAFLRWRADNPTKRMTNTDINNILARTRLMYIDMIRSSNNDVLQSSLPSIPAQFITYHKNLAELMTGSRLTGAEKARMFMMEGALWGMPIGAATLPFVSASLPMYPVHESIRQEVLERGIDTDANLVTKFLMDGAASMAIEAVSGDKFNPGERYGPGGMTWLRDILDGFFFESIAGASGTSLASTIERIAPFGRALVSVFTDEEDDYYPVRKEDFIDLAREVSSLNQVARVYAAVNAQKYMTRNEQTVMNFDADGVDAVMMAFGLTPQRVSDVYLEMRSNRQHNEAKRSLEKLFEKEFRRAAKYSAEGDEKSARSFYQRARAVLLMSDLTESERREIFRAAMRREQTLLQKVDRSFMLKDPEVRGPKYRKERLEE